jgi:hypothetical protein
MKRVVCAACCIALIAAGFTLRPGGAQPEAPAGGIVQDSTGREDGGAVIERELGKLRGAIEGRESRPSTEVFKDIRLFKTVEAGRVLAIMGSWSGVLGVTCKHCHIIDQWEKEDRSEKQIARDMAGMVNEVNTHLLANIKNLDSPEPRISCWTCHRGKPIPEYYPPRAKKE